MRLVVVRRKVGGLADTTAHVTMTLHEPTVVSRYAEPPVKPRKAIWRLVLCACAVLWPNAGHAQSIVPSRVAGFPIPNAPADPVAVADSLAQGHLDVQAGRWTPAIRRLRWALERAPFGGADWRSLMLACFGAHDWSGSTSAAEQAYSLGTRDQREVALFAAAAHGQRGSRDSAFLWLGRALVDQHFEFRASLDDDPDFAPLRSDARWAALVRPPRPSTDRVAGWRGDLAWMTAELKRLNAPIGEPVLTDTFTGLAARLAADIPDLDDATVTVRLMQLVASLGRGHNGLFPWLPSRVGGLNQAPVSLFVFAGGDVRIVHAAAPFERLIGYRVKQVGDLPTLTALATVASVVERENDMDLLWRGPEFLASPAVLHALGASKSRDSLRLVLEVRGRDSLVMLPTHPFARRRPLGGNPNASAPLPATLRATDAPFSAQWLSAERVLYVEFNNVVDARDETLQSFGRRLARMLDARRPSAVVLDLRRNNGGDTYLYQSLLRTLVAWDARGPGRVYAIIGRNTYSAAENFIVDLDRLTSVTFVGEPSGAKPSTHGNESPITLPYSGLQGGLSAVYWQIGDARDKRLWIAPQLFVPPTAQDWLANRDAPLAAILRHLRTRARDRQWSREPLTPSSP